MSELFFLGVNARFCHSVFLVTTNTNITNTKKHGSLFILYSFQHSTCNIFQISYYHVSGIFETDNNFFNSNFSVNTFIYAGAFLFNKCEL